MPKKKVPVKKRPFKPGDIVVLKSGGPVMTLSRYKDDELVICVWFDCEGNRQGEEFRDHTLREPRAQDQHLDYLARENLGKRR